MKRILLDLLFSFVGAVMIFAVNLHACQDNRSLAVAGESKPSFEVASVKPNNSNNGSSIDSSPGRFVAIGLPLRLLMMQAYNLRDFQILGGPSWIETDRWDIEAKVGEGTPPADPPVPSQPKPMVLML